MTVAAPAGTNWLWRRPWNRNRCRDRVPRYSAWPNAVNSDRQLSRPVRSRNDQFGQSFFADRTNAIGGVSAAADSTQGYNQFMSTYTNTPAAQYQLQQADQVQNNSAAASGNLLSGSNERALGTINSGIVAQNATMRTTNIYPATISSSANSKVRSAICFRQSASDRRRRASKPALIRHK